MITDWRKTGPKEWTHLSGKGQVNTLHGEPDTWVAWWDGKKVGMFWDSINIQLGEQFALGCVERAQAKEDRTNELKAVEGLGKVFP